MRNGTRFPVELTDHELLAVRSGAQAVGLTPGAFLRLCCWRTIVALSIDPATVRVDAALLRGLEATGESGVELVVRTAAGIGESGPSVALNPSRRGHKETQKQKEIRN